MEARNPFRFGDLALDEAFTDRAAELAALTSDIRNGQNVVLFAPRRYGKTSLLWRASQELVRGGEVLVAQVDLMTAPTKERLAGKLAAAIYEQIASPLIRVRDRAIGVFRGLRVVPTMSVELDGSMRFSFSPGRDASDLDDTIEHLLRLPAQLAADRDQRVALVLDEFQEIVKLDPALLGVLRAVFQEQPEVAHVYAGSRRHMMDQIFRDENEPFWRSAKHMELGVIPPAAFAPYIDERFSGTGRAVAAKTVRALLGITRAHPYGTQELAYAVWEETPAGETAGAEHLARGLAQVLRSEHAHFARIWERASRGQRVVLEALADDPGRPPMGAAYRRAHDLPGSSTVQRALAALEDDELIARDGAGYRIAEPFLAEWLVGRGR